jgi:DNA invertase Pin-like site-specific DNA recombinase
MRVDTAASKKWRAIETSMKPIVAYVRVSTNQQGRSGLGVEAQREAMSRFAQSEGVDLVAEFVEVETGKGSDALDRRPQLAAALDRARALRCPVAVSKLDRLSRDVHFVSGLMKLSPPRRTNGSTSGPRSATTNGTRCVATTLRAIAAALNARGVPTPRAGRWHSESVRNALARV